MKTKKLYYDVHCLSTFEYKINFFDCLMLHCKKNTRKKKSCKNRKCTSNKIAVFVTIFHETQVSVFSSFQDVNSLLL